MIRCLVIVILILVLMEAEISIRHLEGERCQATKATPTVKP